MGSPTKPNEVGLVGNEKAKCKCDILCFLNKKHKSLELVLPHQGLPSKASIARLKGKRSNRLKVSG